MRERILKKSETVASQSEPRVTIKAPKRRKFKRLLTRSNHNVIYLKHNQYHSYPPTSTYFCFTYFYYFHCNAFIFLKAIQSFFWMSNPVFKKTHAHPLIFFSWKCSFCVFVSSVFSLSNLRLCVLMYRVKVNLIHLFFLIPLRTTRYDYLKLCLFPWWHWLIGIDIESLSVCADNLHYSHGLCLLSGLQTGLNPQLSFPVHTNRYMVVCMQTLLDAAIFKLKNGALHLCPVLEIFQFFFFCVSMSNIFDVNIRKERKPSFWYLIIHDFWKCDER